MGPQFEFCRVCRQNHNQGRGHRYSTKHKQNLDRLSGKMLQRVREIRRLLENVHPVTNAAGAKGMDKFWCHFCELEIFVNESSSSSFAGAEAIKHLASFNHVQNIKSFWEKNGGDFEKQNIYIIQGKDLARWEERCNAALRASVEGDEQQLSRNSSNSIIPAEGSSTIASLSKVDPHPSFLGLSHAQTPSTEHIGEGNVHSGAAPPWRRQKNLTEGDELRIGGAESSSGDLLPLSRNQQAKLMKTRNPNRVGAAWAEQRRAELAREQAGEILSRGAEDISSSWFPSFGRVWQSGPRRDTRKEFEAEKQRSRKLQNQARREKGEARKNAPLSRNFEFKPYVSRRQAKDRV